MIDLRRLWIEACAVLRGQWLLFPRLNSLLVRVYGPVIVEGRISNVKWGKRCRIFHHSHFRLSLEHRPGELCIGDGVTIEAGCFLNAHNGSIIVGESSYIGVRSVIQGKGGVQINPWVMIGPYVQVFSSDHVYRSGSGPYRDRGEIASPVVIGRNVWVGAGAMLLRGTTLGDDCVVAAASVVKGRIDSGQFVSGPAQLAQARDLL